MRLVNLRRWGEIGNCSEVSMCDYYGKSMCDIDTSVKFAAEPHRLGQTRTNIDDV